MCWEKVNQKYLERYHKDFVLSKEHFEKNFIINTIQQEFPTLARTCVLKAVEESSQNIPAPRPRVAFFKEVEKQLNNILK
ncbi:hypothetical protein OX284_012310 [Flavobacterium sp. SUN046]|jgi:hypothetical protein|uniref:hypothetical protein n=1 Tax=Flavobacterium sp. SUN046 TaxID=3002440 RepID=UPI002DC0056E|nr:hypothetical protein [Flavobacterium sp. SUN046]MEC4050217.1 hypothetical protein [Flavobacterium sp. SUN046]